MTPPIEICPDCQKPLRFRGVQRFDVRGVEVDLMDCDNPDCLLSGKTFSYHERPIPPEILAARKERLKETIRLHSAAVMLR